MRTRVEVQSRKALAQLTSLPERVQRVAAAATNRTLASVRAELVRQVRKQAALPAGYVREQYQIRSATSTDLAASLSARKRGILMTRFPHRQLYLPAEGRKRRRAGEKKIRRGVAVTIKPGSSKTIAGGFLLGLRNGTEASSRQGVAVRVGKGRSEVRVLYGPSPSQMFQTLLPELQKRANEQYVKEMRRALGVALRGATE